QNQMKEAAPMPVPYDYYRIFYYVAQYRSFTRAAEVLHGSQPNITRTINLLEQELGCRLFERSHRGVALTPEGGQLFAHVQIMQEQMQAAESELASRRSLHSGRVAIGASETALHGLLLPARRDFRRRDPGGRPQHRGAGRWWRMSRSSRSRCRPPVPSWPAAAACAAAGWPSAPARRPCTDCCCRCCGTSGGGTRGCGCRSPTTPPPRPLGR